MKAPPLLLSLLLYTLIFGQQTSSFYTYSHHVKDSHATVTAVSIRLLTGSIIRIISLHLHQHQEFPTISGMPTGPQANGGAACGSEGRPKA